MDALLAFLTKLAALVPALAVFAPVFAFVIDLAKRLKLPDGYAPLVQSVLNVAGLAVLYALTDAQRAQLPDAVANFQVIAPYILALFVSVLVTPLAHKALTAVGLGFSHSAGNSGEVG